MSEELNQNIATRLTEIELFFLQRAARNENVSISEFVRNAVLKALPMCMICQRNFADKEISSLSGIRISVCGSCAVREATLRGARITRDFLQENNEKK